MVVRVAIAADHDGCMMSYRKQMHDAEETKAEGRRHRSLGRCDTFSQEVLHHSKIATALDGTGRAIIFNISARQTPLLDYANQKGNRNGSIHDVLPVLAKDVGAELNWLSIADARVVGDDGGLHPLPSYLATVHGESMQRLDVGAASQLMLQGKVTHVTPGTSLFKRRDGSDIPMRKNEHGLIVPFYIDAYYDHSADYYDCAFATDKSAIVQLQLQYMLKTMADDDVLLYIAHDDREDILDMIAEHFMQDGHLDKRVVMILNQVDSKYCYNYHYTQPLQFIVPRHVIVGDAALLPWVRAQGRLLRGGVKPVVANQSAIELFDEKMRLVQYDNARVLGLIEQVRDIDVAHQMWQKIRHNKRFDAVFKLQALASYCANFGETAESIAWCLDTIRKLTKSRRVGCSMHQEASDAVVRLIQNSSPLNANRYLSALIQKQYRPQSYLRILITTHHKFDARSLVKHLEQILQQSKVELIEMNAWGEQDLTRQLRDLPDFIKLFCARYFAQADAMSIELKQRLIKGARLSSPTVEKLLLLAAAVTPKDTGFTGSLFMSATLKSQINAYRRLLRTVDEASDVADNLQAVVAMKPESAFAAELKTLMVENHWDFVEEEVLDATFNR